MTQNYAITKKSRYKLSRFSEVLPTERR